MSHIKKNNFMPMERTVLENGIVVLTRKITTSRAVSIGFWIKSGSTFETADENGYSHFLEHMMFKGTVRRTEKQIAHEIDKVGAYINAGTSKEYTSYYINIIQDKLDVALDILTDILENSTFLPENIAKEKQVVLEEIKMYEDTPPELVQDNLLEGMLSGHPLARPILGRKDLIEAIDRDKLSRFYGKHYYPHNLIVAAAGNLNHKKIIDYLNRKKFLHKRKNGKNSHTLKINNIRAREMIVEKDLAQVNFCLGFPGLPLRSELRFALHIVNAVLGSSMSSILFQKIRENMGLCYSIYSFENLFKDLGIFGIYSATSIRNFEKELNEIIRIIREFRKLKIKDETIRDAKEHLKGNLALAFESIDTHMNNLGRQELFYQKHYLFDDLIRLIDKVNKDQIHQVLHTIFPDRYKIIISSIGNKKHRKILEKLDLVI
ncbi:MAG: pitrilysin family protein [bacterium]|nr:pitrilysin family protein [bacterium]